MMDKAWELFGATPPGWRRVQAICDFVHAHIKFNYQDADATRGAARGFAEQRGVCRDFAHLAVTFCRCLNIPARYCTGYLGDIGVPPDPAPMDFSAWFEAFVGGRWHTFDARHNVPRIGRVLIARGRDAADVAISTTFGQTSLQSFVVTTREVDADVLSEFAAPQCLAGQRLIVSRSIRRHSGARAAASPESIFTGGGYGFRAPLATPLGSPRRNDVDSGTLERVARDMIRAWNASSRSARTTPAGSSASTRARGAAPR